MIESRQSNVSCYDDGSISIGCEEQKSSYDLQSTSKTIRKVGCETLTDSNSEITEQSDCPWQDPTYFSSQWKECIFVATCMLSNILNQAGQSQALSTMNVISDSFHSDARNQTWLMASFPLVSGSFILISGRIGDIYGLKVTLLYGFAVSIIWSIICGLANYSHSDVFFIICRCFQGLGISFVLPNIMGIVGNIYKTGTLRKNIVISCIGIAAPAGAALGGIWAGLIATENKTQWPWIFYAYGLVGVINMIMAWLVIPDNIPTNVNGFTMDWIGSVLGVLGLIVFNFCWNQGPIVGWEKAYIIVLLILSFFTLIAFFVYEVRYAKCPLLPPAVFENHHIILILTCMFLGWGSFGIWTFYYYAFQLNLRHYSPLWAGGTFFVFIIFGTIAAFVVALTIHRVGPAFLLTCAMVAFTVGSVMLSCVPVEQSYWRMNLGMQILLSFGMDLSFPAASIILSDFLPMQYQGMAGSLVNTIVNYSTSLCLGMGTTVESQVNKDGTNKLKGYRSAVYLGIGLAGLGVIVSLFNLLETVLRKHREKKAKKEKPDFS